MIMEIVFLIFAIIYLVANLFRDIYNIGDFEWLAVLYITIHRIVMMVTYFAGGCPVLIIVLCSVSSTIWLISVILFYL